MDRSRADFSKWELPDIMIVVLIIFIVDGYFKVFPCYDLYTHHKLLIG